MKAIVKCNWIKCAHGYGLAHTEGEVCYADGTFDQVDCEKFITDEDYEKKMNERPFGR